MAETCKECCLHCPTDAPYARTAEFINLQSQAAELRELAQRAVIALGYLRRLLQNFEPDMGYPSAEDIEEEAVALGLVWLNSIGNLEKEVDNETLEG